MPLSIPFETKVWGSTRCVYESSKFSGHELNVHRRGYTSIHIHKMRKNRLIIESGVIAIVTFCAWQIDRTILTVGKTFDVPSLVPHQFQVIQDGMIREEYWADRGGSVEQDDIVRLVEGGMVDDIERFQTLAQDILRAQCQAT